MKKIFTPIICSILLILSSCSSSDDKTSCAKNAQTVSQETFNNVITNYTITDVALNEDCLDITISSSGCSGESWQMSLFSNPQRDLKVKLVNQELCLAVLEKTTSFSLIPLRIQGQHQVTLNIDGWAEPIVYNY